MVNVEEFSKKLIQIMEYHDLSASAFADKINVQRSSISHLLSGRNKPSLDFILKVLNEFTDVKWEWLLNDKGNYPSENNEAPNLFTQTEKDKNPEIKKTTQIRDDESLHLKFDNSIEQIVIFYSDGTFKNYLSSNK